MLALNSISGNVVVCSWLFERAGHWVLDRFGVMGQVGAVLLANDDEEEFDENTEDPSTDDKPVVNDSREIPNRKIYCLDFKASNKADDFIEEVKRIYAENAVNVVTLGDVIGASDNGNPSNGLPIASAAVQPSDGKVAQANRIEESGGRRWYPVIDYNRCTNCMECIDFCLFGVYGVDRIDTILVEQPDNCRKGCPACSRVCPENAIMFPQHKTPAIAGSNDAAASMKIDLSQLFGAPASGKSAEEVAAMELSLIHI